MDQVSLMDCVRFHGHLCGGVTLGYIMANFAMAQLNAVLGDELYCRMECQNCMVDGVQCATGCTIGKGNLELYLTGKSAMTLVRRDSGKGIRVTAKFSSPKQGLSPQETSDLMMQTDPAEICHAEEAMLMIPKKERYPSVICPICGEEFSVAYTYEVNGMACCRSCAEK